MLERTLVYMYVIMLGISLMFDQPIPLVIGP